MGSGVDWALSSLVVAPHNVRIYVVMVSAMANPWMGCFLKEIKCQHYGGWRDGVNIIKLWWKTISVYAV